MTENFYELLHAKLGNTNLRTAADECGVSIATLSRINRESCAMDHWTCIKLCCWLGNKNPLGLSWRPRAVSVSKHKANPIACPCCKRSMRERASGGGN